MSTASSCWVRSVENAALEPREKKRVLGRREGRLLRGRVPVLSGVVETSTAASIRYAREAEKMGLDGLMVLPAMIYRADAAETLAHFRAVARGTGLPIICCNNPLAYVVDITPQMFVELAEIRNLVAIKESSGDVRRITDLRNAVGDRLRVVLRRR